LSRRENFGICEQKVTKIGCVLFCRAAKTFGMDQQKQLKLAVCCFAAQRKAWNLLTQKQLKLTAFCLPHSEKFWNLSTKTTQIDCTLFCRATKILEFANTNATQIVCSTLPRSENLGYCKSPVAS
jgi:hypothetical protein